MPKGAFTSSSMKQSHSVAGVSPGNAVCLCGASFTAKDGKGAVARLKEHILEAKERESNA